MPSRPAKSANAFRTISEVADSMEIPQHVLRFWESKFSQICPMKRGGGRRYYRPEDVEIIEAIRKLLHEDGYTIKGAQKYLRENGVKKILESYHNDSVADDDPQEAAAASRVDYDAQILSIAKKSKLVADADGLSNLKDLRARLEKIRRILKV